MLLCVVGVLLSIFKVDLRWYTAYAYLREGKETDLSPGLCYQLGGTIHCGYIHVFIKSK